MKTIVTHIGPDLDAIVSIWLVKKFYPEWLEADIAFVPAGQTYKGLPPDDNPDVMHVDTGYGKYDHHKEEKNTCAASLVYDDIKKEFGAETALERLVALVNDVDHFREAFFPDPTNDFWDLGLPALIDGWRLIYADNPIRIVTVGMECIDGVYKMFQNKVWAEKDIKEKAIPFDTRWGKGFGIETTNDEVVHLGQKMGYVVVLRKDPRKGYLRVKALPKDEIDLTPVFEALKAKDPGATWYLHQSKHMILNGSTKNPDMKPTTLSLHDIIELVKKEVS